MNDIKNCTIRTELPPMTQEEAQRKFERFEKLEKKLGTKEVKEDSLIKNFAEGMISGAISAPLNALGPLAAIAGPSIMSAVGGRIRNVQILNSDGATKVLNNYGITKVLARGKKNNPNKNNSTNIIHEPGVITYVVGAGVFGLGAALSSTPLGPLLMGLGIGMMGSGISTSGEAGAEEARNRNRNRRE